jgi:spore germination cell wall hydrolase CwlJ-like protein
MKAVIATFIAVFLALVPSIAFASESSIDCIAKAIFHEARAESVEGKLAVGYVILNRTKVSEHFPDTPCAVIYQPGQFIGIRKETMKNHDQYDKARSIAEEVVSSPDDDNTNGALYFHNVHVHPSWSRGMIASVKIGNHMFYKKIHHGR